MAIKILTWKCPQCGKVIESMWANQLDQNRRMHNYTHEDKIVDNGVGVKELITNIKKERGDKK